MDWHRENGNAARTHGDPVDNVQPALFRHGDNRLSMSLHVAEKLVEFNDVTLGVQLRMNPGGHVLHDSNPAGVVPLEPTTPEYNFYGVVSRRSSMWSWQPPPQKSHESDRKCTRLNSSHITIS